ncbi:response regulator transcription factor [Corynebacterium belfantii]|uniref:response regulator transcription factor n=1 Tax=Corynebacterium belfantii TaxID=2014537 RepID=UPI0018D28AA5|nr:helix-turn-helix transcriptional regulator [Corynebacterium belfantii]MBG9350264.1 helix-turn-helix transcriptional regulator [Corynebacterium belfantii]
MHSHLTRREAQVFELLMQRRYNSEIADALSISVQTVKNYTSRIYSKLGIASRRDLFQLVFQDSRSAARTSQKSRPVQVS